MGAGTLIGRAGRGLLTSIGFSCPGCSYKSPCCCAAPPKPVTKTLTSTLTVAPRRAAPTTRRRKITTRRIKRRPAVRSETDSLNLEKRQFSDQSDGVDVERRRIGAAAQGRHLCPICPPGNSISAYSPSKIWSGVQFCCPKRKRSTVTVRKTVTKTKRRPGPFNIYATTSKRRSTESPLATHVGLAFEDNDNDGKYNPEIDDPITDQWILIRYGNKTNCMLA